LDEATFTALYRANAAWLRSYVQGIVHDVDAASDIVHDTLMKALARPPGAVPMSWLRTVARNAAVDHLRRARRMQAEDPAAIDRRRERDGAGARALSSHVEAALTELPASQRVVMALRFAHGLPAREAASALGKTPDAIRQLESRALRTLRSALDRSAAGG
jgi:RNA polymerase sigma-70 factor (ECF subfamily)